MRLRQNAGSKDPIKLRKAAIVFGVLLALFVFGEAIHLPPAVSAIIGAVAILIWVHPDIEAMMPVVDYLTTSIPGAGNMTLFYALSVGAAMGGNNSLIGASSNLVTAGIAARAGYPISFKRFLAAGLPSVLVTVALGSVWLFIRFF